MTEPAAAQTSAIFGGEPAPNDPAVFYLRFANGGACSAVLIAPRTLLTAAHCVDSPIAWASNETIATSGPRYRVLEQRSVSGVVGDWTPDLGLVLLETAPPVTPMRWMASGPFPQPGTLLRHVGYGLTETGGVGERRQVTVATAGAAAPAQFGISITTATDGKGVCFGDSGGPALVRDAVGELVAGIHSYVVFGCGRETGSALVFPYHRFIEDWLAQRESASCARDRRCVQGCVPADLDCTCGPDGTCSAQCVDGDDPDCPSTCAPDGFCDTLARCPVDLDCIPVGTRCLRDEQCGSRICIADPQNPSKYCSLSCSAAACPGGLQCSPQAVCIKAQREVLPLGRPCVVGELCATGTKCSAAWGSPARCLSTCESSLTCLKGTRCDFAEGVCVPAPPLTLDAGLEAEGPLAPVGGCMTTPSSFLLLGALVMRRSRRGRATGASRSR